MKQTEESIPTKQEMKEMFKRLAPFAFTSNTNDGETIHLAQDNYKTMGKEVGKVLKKIIKDGEGTITFKNGLKIRADFRHYLPFTEYLQYGKAGDFTHKVTKIEYSKNGKMLGTAMYYKRLSN